MQSTLTQQQVALLGPAQTLLTLATQLVPSVVVLVVLVVIVVVGGRARNGRASLRRTRPLLLVVEACPARSQLVRRCRTRRRRPPSLLSACDVGGRRRPSKCSGFPGSTGALCSQVALARSASMRGRAQGECRVRPSTLPVLKPSRGPRLDAAF